MVVQDLTSAKYKQMALDLLVRADDSLITRDYDSVSMLTSTKDILLTFKLRRSARALVTPLISF